MPRVLDDGQTALRQFFLHDLSIPQRGGRVVFPPDKQGVLSHLGHQGRQFQIDQVDQGLLHHRRGVAVVLTAPVAAHILI